VRAAAALAAALALVALAVPAHAAEVTRSPEATAISINGLFQHTGAMLPNASKHAGLIAGSGIRTARADAFWPWAEPRAPFLGMRSYTWRSFDDAVGLLAANDLRLLPELAYSTLWSTTVPGDDHAPPVNDADYAAYAGAFARRFGRGGEFWSAHPELPALPVTAYHVWNEPNLQHFWRPQPDAARYARLYRAAREAIKRSDPDATVVLGGLSPLADSFVESAYAAEPALRGNVDALAYHPYGATPAHVLKQVRRMRSTLDGLGEGAVPLWITELGWPTQGKGGLPSPLPDRTRAGNVSLLTDALLGSNCDVDVVAAYQWVAAEREAGFDEHWMGIYRHDGTPTETGVAYRESVARNAALAGPRPALGLCEGASRGGAGAPPLELGLGLRATGKRCFDATVTYRGRPVNGVVVTFAAGPHSKNASTSSTGVAKRCLPRAAAGRRLKATARLLDVAASGTARGRVR
jgi:hypothetical protein